jgi:A/G-specific adenine glycosylase
VYKKLHDALYEWYQINGRHHLPWRRTDDAYKIWVSEIMLQQTQVKTVLERFYFPFLEAFPTLQDLAAATESEVLKKWEGLGYYTRARNLHKTAKLCHSQLPTSVSDLVTLPGIGQSTAHAIAAFAYKRAVPILDANVKRILYRFFGKKRATEKELWHLAEILFDDKHPYEYNQAMMDLGSSLCNAKTFTCNFCPLSSGCVAAQENPLLFPEKKEKRVVPIRQKDIVVFKSQERYALKQRRSRLLNGLWGFAEYDRDSERGGIKLGAIVQKYTHFHLHADVYISEAEVENHEWFNVEAIGTLALSRADLKVLELLKKHF